MRILRSLSLSDLCILHFGGYLEIVLSPAHFRWVKWCGLWVAYDLGVRENGEKNKQLTNTRRDMVFVFLLRCNLLWLLVCVLLCSFYLKFNISSQICRG